MLPSAASLLFTPRALARYGSILAFGFLVSYQCRFLTAIHDEQLGASGGGGEGNRHALSFMEGSVLMSLMKSKQEPSPKEEEEKLLDDSYYYFDDAEEGEGEDKGEAKEGAAHEDAHAGVVRGDDVDDLELHCPTLLQEVQPKRTAANPTGSDVTNPSPGATVVDAEDEQRQPSPELVKVWTKVLSESPKNSVVIDVGADAGHLSLWSSAASASRDDVASKSLQVHALQPDPDRAVQLCESLELRIGTRPDRNVHVYALGASNREVKKELVTLDTLATKRGWINKSATANEKRDFKINIAILSLYAPGHEIRALKGAPHLLRSGLVRNVFVEFPPAGLNGTYPISNVQLVVQRMVGEYKYILVGWGGNDGPTQRHNNQLRQQKQPPSPTELAAAVLRDVQKHPTENVQLWFAPEGAAQR